MAQVGSITAESSSSEFLEQAKTEELAEKFDGGNLAKIADEFTKVIEEHKTKGLSRRALSLEGRSPLNEIANEMIARLQVTVTDVEDAKAITEAKGNDHTNKEADKFLKEVLKKYEEKCKKVDEALRSCENASYQEKYKDGEEEKTRTVYCKNGITVKYSIDGASTTKITKSGSRDSDSHFDDEYAKFEEAFKAAETYYDGKVKEAIDFYNANGKGALPTGGADGIPLSMPNDEALPEGVQPDAKKEEHSGSRGQRVVYTNPDGSTVEIVKENGKTTKHVVRNRYGYTTETYKYDDDGNMTHKNVWSYKKVGDHVYESSYTRYEKNSSGEWEATGEPQSYGYSYPVEDENGNVTIKNQKGGDAPTGGAVAGGSTAASAAPVELTDRDEFREDILPNHKSFILHEGDKIVVDGKGNIFAKRRKDVNGNYITVDLPDDGNPLTDDGTKILAASPNQKIKATSETGDITMIYDENDGVYYPYDSNGDKIDNFFLDPNEILGENRKNNGWNNSKIVINGKKHRVNQRYNPKGEFYYDAD